MEKYFKDTRGLLFSYIDQTRVGKKSQDNGLVKFALQMSSGFLGSFTGLGWNLEICFRGVTPNPHRKRNTTQPTRWAHGGECLLNFGTQVRHPFISEVYLISQRKSVCFLLSASNVLWLLYLLLLICCIAIFTLKISPHCLRQRWKSSFFFVYSQSLAEPSPDKDSWKKLP